MKNIGGFSRLSNQQPSLAMIQRFAGCIGVAILLMMTGIAAAQNPTPTNPLPAPEAQMSAPTGYSAHSSVDVGGRMAGIDGSGAMYDTLVNMQSGPRVLGETFEMRALPGNKSTFADTLTAFSTGFGGDPNSFSKLAFSKGKTYDFSGIFRRDRQYFDYDLLGNPNIPSGQAIPVTGSTTPLAWPQVNQSPFMFNTVRRMTDTHLTLLPLSKVTFRAGYSQNIFQGPSLTPSGYQVASSYDILLEEMQRNSTDDFTGGIDWKPVRGTKLTFEEEIDHYKQNSYFVMDPSYFNVQEANGTPVALLANYDSLTPYASSACNANSMGGTPMLSPANTPGGPPIINAACAVLTSYLRTASTRIFYPTETFRLQSNSLKNVSMNGDVRYTKANMGLPSYYDSFEGLSKTTRSLAYTAIASAEREVMAVDYGIVWQVTKTFAFEDQFTFSNVQQPGTATMMSLTTVATAATANNETINNPTLITTVVNTPTTPATGTFEGSGSIGVASPDFFGQKRVNNDFTLTWDATPRTMLSLTYRYGTHTIAEGIPQGAPLAVNATNDGTVTINETGGIFSAADDPAANQAVPGAYHVQAKILGDDLGLLQRPGAPQQHQQRPVGGESRDRTITCCVRRPARSRGLQPRPGLRRGTVPERSLRHRLQLRLQRRIHGGQHLLPGGRERGFARCRFDSQRHFVSGYVRGQIGIRFRPRSGLHACSHAIRFGGLHCVAGQECQVQHRLQHQLSEWHPLL
jgi:hypothetical protein